MDPKDTAPAETATVPSSESAATPQAPDSVQEPANIEAPATVEESAEELRKQLQKIEQERNLYKNKADKAEKEREERRQAELSETERLTEELNTYKQKEAYETAEQFRSQVIEETLKDNPAALKAAKALIAKNPSNLTWGEGADEDQARADLVSQLESLAEVIGSPVAAPAANEEPSARVNPNNPAPLDQPPLDRSELIREAAKTGDFSKVIGTIPSIQAQVQKVNE